MILRDLVVREVELRQRRRDLAARLERSDIRAPVGGIVHGATVFNRGAVIQGAEPLMFIVPQDQPLLVAARIPARDVDQVSLGQEVSLKFAAFDGRSTPEIGGVTRAISPDAFVDEATGRGYYSVEVQPNADAFGESSGLRLVPGMPVDAYLKTGNRTPLSYLVQPIADYFGRAFREG